MRQPSFTHFFTGWLCLLLLGLLASCGEDSFPVFVIGTPKFQDWVAISIKS